MFINKRATEQKKEYYKDVWMDQDKVKSTLGHRKAQQNSVSASA